MQIPGVLPRTGFGKPLFPVAMPLGEGHVPAALGCGVMNGARLAPDDPALGLPDIYAKAVFRRQWRTKEEKKDKYGHLFRRMLRNPFHGSDLRRECDAGSVAARRTVLVTDGDGRPGKVTTAASR